MICLPLPSHYARHFQRLLVVWFRTRHRRGALNLSLFSSLKHSYEQSHLGIRVNDCVRYVHKVYPRCWRGGIRESRVTRLLRYVRITGIALSDWNGIPEGSGTSRKAHHPRTHVTMFVQTRSLAEEKLNETYTRTPVLECLANACNRVAGKVINDRWIFRFRRRFAFHFCCRAGHAISACVSDDSISSINYTLSVLIRKDPDDRTQKDECWQRAKQSEEVLTNDLLISARCLKNRSSKIPEEIAEIREEDETFDFMRSSMFLPCLLRIKTPFAASSLVFLGSSFYFIVSTFSRLFFGRSLSTSRHLSQSDHVRAFPISLASVETNERS